MPGRRREASDDHNRLIEPHLPKGETPAEEGFATSGNSKASNANMRLLTYEYPELTPGTKRYGTVAETVFPVACPNQCICQPVDSVRIIDSSRAYEPPAIIQANFTKIISAHQGSHMHNRTVIRVDDRSCSDGRLCLWTSRSTYFNSAVTNRAMDYDFGEVTVRKLFEYGPRVSPLNASKLSNHLGHNAFVITADGHVPFVVRSKELSIGKLTLGCSIGAGVKSKYALGGESGEFSPAGLLNSVTCEIEDELKVEPSEVVGTPQTIAPYRDLLEGGKPQLCICAHTSLDREALGKRFKRVVSKKPRGGLPPDAELLEDGKVIVWASREKLREAAIAPGFLFVAGRKYAMLPSMAASVALLIKSGLLSEERS